jgi:hypothetical protein
MHIQCALLCIIQRNVAPGGVRWQPGNPYHSNADYNCRAPKSTPDHSIHRAIASTESLLPSDAGYNAKIAAWMMCMVNVPSFAYWPTTCKQ